MIDLINVNDLSLSFGSQVLFKDVNLSFTEENCYGVIGANGAGKSTFLRILSGELEPSKGSISIKSDKRMSILKQDHYAFDEYTVMDTVIMGNEKLYNIMKEKDALYAKPDFSDEDGIKASELEAEFADMDGWNAESEASSLLQGLGIATKLHETMMDELNGNEKVKVLLAQTLFGKPDILILDEPTNHLDVQSIRWLQRFLGDFHGTVIVVSHDRYFLNEVSTHIVDIDFQQIKMFSGNYDFWYESSQLAAQMAKNENKKKSEKIKELEAFVARFSANASKSKQATSRRKLLEKITLDDIQPSTRRYPYIGFDMEREVGNEILTVDKLSKTVDGVKVLDEISFRVNRDDKIAFIGNEIAITTLFEILNGNLEADGGDFTWGQTITKAYFPKDNSEYFDGVNLNLIDWMRQFTDEQSEIYLRGFLGRMLFSGEEALKEVNVLSGGEKVRCMFAKMMLNDANVLIFDQPTNHLDLESITAVNEGLKKYKSNILFSSHDHQFINTIANRIINITPEKFEDFSMSYEEYLERLEGQNNYKY